MFLLGHTATHVQNRYLLNIMDFQFLKPDPITGAPTFIPEPTQQSFLFSRVKHTHMAGGVRGGKTLAMCYKVAVLSRMFDGNLILMGRLKLPDLEDTVIPDFRLLLEELGWEYSWRDKPHPQCVFPNKSKVIFRHLMDYQGRMGLNLGAFGIDQIEEVPEKTFDILRTRLSRAAPPTKDPAFQELLKYYRFSWRGITMSTSNPAGHNWVWRRWKLNHEARKIGAPFNARYDLFEVETDEQRSNLPAGYIEDTFDGESSEYELRYRFGSWEDFKNSIYSGIYRPEIHSIKPETPHAPDAIYYRGYDHGGIAHEACCLFAYFSPNPFDGEMECVIFDEYVADGGSPDEHAEAILPRHLSLNFQVTYADAQVKARTQYGSTHRQEVMSLMEIYAEHGFDLTPANRDLTAGITMVQRWMKIKPGHLHRFLKDKDGKPLDGAPHLYISRHCIRLLEQVMTYHRSQLIPGRIVDYKNDAVDAMRFLLASPLGDLLVGGILEDSPPKTQTQAIMEQDIERAFEPEQDPNREEYYSIFD